MEPIKKRIIDRIIETEGGYVNDPNDAGGETNFGITRAVAKANGYYGAMQTMPRSVALDIYCEKYWDSVKAGSVSLLSEAIAEEMVDTAVNMGPSRAVQFLQRSLNVLNKGGRLYDDLLADSIIGPTTLAALSLYLRKRDEIVLLRALNSLQGAFYIELAERRGTDEAFLYGWLKNRVAI